jgi:hypothetical protein
MEEQDFRDYRLLLDEQAEQIFANTDDVGARAQDLRNTPIQHAASIHKNLPLEMMMKLVVWMSGQPCTTKVQFSANFSARIVLQTPVLVDRDFRLAHRRGTSTRQ